MENNVDQSQYTSVVKKKEEKHKGVTFQGTNTSAEREKGETYVIKWSSEPLIIKGTRTSGETWWRAAQRERGNCPHYNG